MIDRTQFADAARDKRLFSADLISRVETSLEYRPVIRDDESVSGFEIHAHQAARPTLTEPEGRLHRPHRDSLRHGPQASFRPTPSRPGYRGEIGHQPLYPGVLVFELPQAARLIDLEAPVLRLPAVERVLADAVPPAELSRLPAGLDPLQDPDASVNRFRRIAGPPRAS